MEKRNFIVYKITNKINKNIYIGCHITKNINDSYMGSGSRIGEAIREFGRENFEKIILWNFDNKDDMLAKENELVNDEFIKRDDTYNVIVGGGYNTSNTVTVRDNNGKTFNVHIQDPRYLSGELVSITKDMVIVKDNSGNVYKVRKDDPRYLSGEFISVLKDSVVVRNNLGEHMRVNIDDSRYLSGELEFLWKNKKHTEKSKKLIGEKNSKHQMGEGNSQYGTCWIYNEKKKENKKISKDELNKWINNGWLKGRKIK